VIPVSFTYERASSIDDAIAKMAGGGKLIAGGHSLVPLMKLRLSEPGRLIDIARISELSGILEAGGRIEIGATTTHHEIASSKLLRDKCPMVAEAAAEIGDAQVRNRGTIGGSIAHADPAADWPAAVLALDAQITLVNNSGSRTVGATDFFLELLTTAMESDEILTEIRVPANPARTGSAYLKVAQPASGFALTGVAAQVTLGSDNTVQQVAVAVTGVDNTAFRASATENALRGQAATEAAIEQAANLATEGVEGTDDIHASAEYRLHLTRVYTKRALLQAVQRAQA
jgi:aerobic carbon-monoxide dehydrogenase medium subunit